MARRVCTLIATVCLSAVVQAGYSPTRTEVNIGGVPIDAYHAVNSGNTYYPSTACPSTYTVQNCIHLFFNNNPASPPYTASNYRAQGVTGVRFFFGIGDSGGFSSTPWDASGNVRSQWIANMHDLLVDLKAMGITNVTLTPAWHGWGQTSYQTNPQTKDLSGTYDLKFYKWLPYGVLANEYPDGNFIASAYSSANANPFFWGWLPFFSLVDNILATAQTVGIGIEEFDLMQEVNFVNFTVQARVVYDTVHGFNGQPTTDVLNGVRYYMSQHGFSPTRVTYSGVTRNPSSGYSPCTSAYGDSAFMIAGSAVMSALAGNKFGPPSGFTVSADLLCGGNTSSMIQLPIGYTPPTIVDMHTTPCVTSGGACQAGGATVATQQYNGFMTMLTTRSLTAAVAMMGESTSNQSCDGYTPQLASDNVTGYQASSLFTQHAALTVMRPWNNSPDQSLCFHTPAIINPPYNPN